MPILWYIDDVFFDGDYEKFKKIALFASYYAVLRLDVEADISGDPLVYFPIYPSPFMVYKYMIYYRQAFDFLEAFLDFE